MEVFKVIFSVCVLLQIVTAVLTGVARNVRIMINRLLYLFSRKFRVKVSDVNKDLRLKAKARTKDKIL